MKKMISVVLTLSMLFVAGCSSKGAEEADTGNNGGQSGELNVLVVTDLDPLEPVFQQYGEENGIKVNVESVPFSEIFETIEVRLGTGEETVDVLVADAPLISNYTAKGYLTPLNDYVDEASFGKNQRIGYGSNGGSKCVNYGLYLFVCWSVQDVRAKLNFKNRHLRLNWEKMSMLIQLYM